MLFRFKSGRPRHTVVIPVPATDARPASEPHPARNAADREAARERRFHRRVAMAVLGAAFLGGLITALFGKGGYLELRRLRAELAAGQAAHATESARVEQLRTHVERLRSEPIARERIARERLGLALPGEITFVLTEPGAGGEPGDGGSKAR